MTATLYIPRGLPGSGKTSWARRRIALREPGSIARISRDDLRRMAADPHYSRLIPPVEEYITAMVNTALGALLRAGVDVIVDATNLRPDDVPGLSAVALDAGAEVRVVEHFIGVPIEECIARDAARAGAEHVGESVIRDLHERYLASPRNPA